MELAYNTETDCALVENEHFHQLFDEDGLPGESPETASRICNIIDFWTLRKYNLRLGEAYKLDINPLKFELLTPAAVQILKVLDCLETEKMPGQSEKAIPANNEWAASCDVGLYYDRLCVAEFKLRGYHA